MTQPTYHAVKRESIESIPLDGAVLRLLAGRYVDENGKLHQGFVGSHLPLDYYELAVEAGHSVEVPVDVDHSVLAFTLGGPRSSAAFHLAKGPQPSSWTGTEWA